MNIVLSTVRNGFLALVYMGTTKEPWGIG